MIIYAMYGAKEQWILVIYERCKYNESIYDDVCIYIWIDIIKILINFIYNRNIVKIIYIYYITKYTWRQSIYYLLLNNSINYW